MDCDRGCGLLKTACITAYRRGSWLRDTRLASNADDETYRIHSLAQTKLQLTGKIVGIVVGPE